jgi:sugar lactone lactonase YvrE
MVQAAGPTSTSSDYSVAVFANAPKGFTNPDSITSFQGTIWVGYQNQTKATGGGGNSNIVQFDPTGHVMKVYTIADKTDGLKFNPFDGKIYALQNEDANPHLVLIDPVTGTMTNFTYSAAPAHGGGYDDIVFLNGQIFISASNPTVQSNGQNTFPSVVKATLNGNQIDVTPVLIGNATLTDIASGKPFVSLQSDPDSLTVDPSGNLVLDSQADGNLIFLNAPGSPNQVGYVLQLTSKSTTAVTVDDTVFPTSASGTIYVADTPANIVYAVTSKVFPPNSAFTSATDSASYVGRIDLQTGAITQIITGLQGAHGALFLPSLPEVRLEQVSSSGGKSRGKFGGLSAEFRVSRTGDVSKALQVFLNINDNSSADPSSSNTQQSVTIPVGASSATVSVALDSKSDFKEDGSKQNVVVSIQPNSGYNVQPNEVQTGVQVLSLPLSK